MTRVYDEPDLSDGLPRGYGHDPARFDGFASGAGPNSPTRHPAAAVRRLREHAHAGPPALLTATRDLDHAAYRRATEVLDG